MSDEQQGGGSPVSGERRPESEDALIAEQRHLLAEIERMQPAVDTAMDLTEADRHLRTLRQRHDRLAEVEAQLNKLSQVSETSGLIVDKGTERMADNRGPDTTELAVRVHLLLAEVPTSVCHLLDPDEEALIQVHIKNTGYKKRRVRIRAYVEGYSAQAVRTIELGGDMEETVRILPTFFPDRLRTLTELSRATLNVIIDDLDSKNIELHESHPIWLLARNSAPIRTWHPTEGKVKDMLPFLGAFVTPHEPSVFRFLSTVASHHPQGRLEGYLAAQGSRPQVRAVFEALRSDVCLTYVSSFIDFNPDESRSQRRSWSQRVRLPRESLETGQANCLDGVVLFASLIEAMSMQPALVFVPGHAVVAWRNSGDGDQWTYLDTTRIGRSDFDKAIRFGDLVNERHVGGDCYSYRFMPLSELREDYGIMPLE